MADDWERRIDQKFDELEKLIREFATTRGITVASVQRMGHDQSSCESIEDGPIVRTEELSGRSFLPKNGTSTEIAQDNGPIQSSGGTLEVGLSDKEGSQYGSSTSPKEVGQQSCSSENNFRGDAHQVFDEMPSKEIMPFSSESSELQSMVVNEDAAIFNLRSSIDNQVKDRTLFVKIHFEEFSISCEELSRVFLRCGVL